MKYNFQCTKGVLSPCFIIVSSQASQCCVASVIVPSDFVASSLNQVLLCYLEKLSHACCFSHLLGERVGPSPSCKQFHVVKLLLLRWLFIADVIFFFSNTGVPRDYAANGSKFTCYIFFSVYTSKDHFLVISALFCSCA